MSVRRMLPFLFINVVVSAVVVLLVLSWWDGRQEPEADSPLLSVADAGDSTDPAGPTLAATGPLTAATEQAEAEPPIEEVEEGEPAEDGPTYHTVQAGDTLGAISQQYDVTIEEIAEANNLTNINTIAVGQEILIPIGGVPTATPAPESSPTADLLPTPLPTEPPSLGTAVVEIVEVVGVGDLTDEAVRISNSGTRPISLLGWEMFDEQGHIYRFVDVTLYGSSEAGSPAILVHTETGRNGPSDLYWSQEAAVWEPGETITVRDAEGTVQATYTVP